MTRISRPGLLWPALAALLSCMVVLAGLLTWWNTDLLGKDDFCDGMFSSSEVSAALEGTGRLAEEEYQQAGRSHWLRCEMKRTSRFVDSSKPHVSVATEFLKGDEVFQSPVWQKRERMAFTEHGLAGGATRKRAWVLVPKECWGGIPLRPGSVPYLTAEVSDGRNPPQASDVTSSPEALLQLADRAAQRVIDDAGCARKSSGRYRLPDATALTSADHHRSDRENICGKRGFTLPPDAFPTADVTLGRERTTSASGTVWACDLHLQGKGGPSLTLMTTSHRDTVAAAKRQATAESLNNGKVVRCEQGEIYVGLWLHNGYLDLLLDEDDGHGRRPLAFLGDVLTSLAKSQAAKNEWNGCHF